CGLTATVALHLSHPQLTTAPRSILFPYTTLFRSSSEGAGSGRPAGDHQLSLAGRPHGEAMHRRSSAPGRRAGAPAHPRKSDAQRSEEHTSELQSCDNLVCRLLLEKNKLWTSSRCM